MKFVRIIDGFDHLWAVKAQGKEADELNGVFDQDSFVELTNE